MKKLFFYLVILLITTKVLGQETNLNKYKYVIVPDKFEFLSDIDKYQVNSLTDFLFEKYGFTSIDKKDKMPSDLEQNPCVALKTDIIDNSGLFVTKLQVVLRDCHDKVVFESKEGRSRSKDYKTAYHESLRDAFTSIEALNYKYDNTSAIANTAKALPVEQVSTEPSPTTNSAKVEETNANIANNKVPAAAVAAPVVVSQEIKPKAKETTAESTEELTNLIKSYKNENISFFIMEQNGKKIAIVNQSKSNIYKKGEQIATFTKTSLPKVYRISWKNAHGKMMQTSGYFDDNGDLKVDIENEGKIEVKTYKLEN